MVGESLFDAGAVLVAALGFVAFATAIGVLGAALEWVVEKRARQIRGPGARTPGRSSCPRT